MPAECASTEAANPRPARATARLAPSRSALCRHDRSSAFSISTSRERTAAGDTTVPLLSDLRPSISAC